MGFILGTISLGTGFDLGGGWDTNTTGAQQPNKLAVAMLA